MSDKTLVYVLIGAFLFAVGLGIFVGWKLKPNKKCPVIIDTSYVKGDTIFIPYPVEIIKWKERKPALVDSVKEERYYQNFDSSFVSYNDTIDIKAEIGFTETTKEFDFDMDIQHKDVEIFRTDTIKVNYIEVKEVEVSDPLWIIVAISEFVLMIGIIILAIGG